MNLMKKIISIILIISILALGMIPVFAEEKTTGESASPEKSSNKEEIIYINTDGGGNVTGMYAVNIFEDDTVTDYGDYSQVKMLNTTDDINYADGRVSYSTDAQKTYYEGILENKESPWNISIKYYLDGEEYNADQLAGADGKLKMHIKISENKSITENSTDKSYSVNSVNSFYDKFALQASLSLNTENCTDITADGATIADVGSDKQLSYTVLPGKGLDTVITADVTDFEMDGISINGIRLSLDIDVDDEEIMGKIGEMIDAVSQINTGAVTMEKGAKSLETGGKSLNKGVKTANSGAVSLNNGIKDLQKGAATMQKGLAKLSLQSGTLTSGSKEIKTTLTTMQKAVSSIEMSSDDLNKLVASSTQIAKAIEDINSGLASLNSEFEAGGAYASLIEINSAAMANATPEMQALLSQNNAALNSLGGSINSASAGMSQLNSNYSQFNSSINDMAKNLGAMSANIDKLTSGLDTLVTEYTKFDTGLNAYTGGVGEVVTGYEDMMTGISSLAKGSKDLSKGTGSLYKGSSSLYDGIITMSDGASELADGTGQMLDGTKEMDSQIEEQMDEILGSLQGDDSNEVSFVSSKNKDVSMVQFVIQTDSITIEEEEEPEAPAKEKQTVWEKIVALLD